MSSIAMDLAVYAESSSSSSSNVRNIIPITSIAQLSQNTIAKTDIFRHGSVMEIYTVLVIHTAETVLHT